MILELTPEEINILLHVLSRGPYATVAKLINNIQQQAIAQKNKS